MTKPFSHVYAFPANLADDFIDTVNKKPNGVVAAYALIDNEMPLVKLTTYLSADTCDNLVSKYLLEKGKEKAHKETAI